MVEEVKRLEATKETIRELFAKAGNQGWRLGDTSRNLRSVEIL
jgi:hypothetical protein